MRRICVVAFSPKYHDEGAGDFVANMLHFAANSLQLHCKSQQQQAVSLQLCCNLQPHIVVICNKNNCCHYAAICNKKLLQIVY